jgi:uncharacterized protein (TIGR02453 family)
LLVAHPRRIVDGCPLRCDHVKLVLVRYFSPQLFTFLRQLKRNNNREWFEAHRATYEEFLRDAFLRFITDIGPLLRRLDPRVIADPHPTRGSLFRIYRDTRFSPDKTPYKIHAAAQFFMTPGGRRQVATANQVAGGKRHVHMPGLYFHLQPGTCFAAGGMWHPEPASLALVRNYIAAAPERWRAARRGLTLEGDTLSRPPRGFPADHPLIDDLRRKDFIASFDFSESQVCGPHFADDFTAACRRLMPLVKSLAEAVTPPARRAIGA